MVSVTEGQGGAHGVSGFRWNPQVPEVLQTLIFATHGL